MTQKTIPKRRAAKSADRIGLLVVGMHRSGTSAVTKTINLLGADLPGNLMPAHAEFNAAGYWESQDVVDLNDHLLMTAGSCWDDVLPVDLAKISSEALHEFKRRAKVILDRDFRECRWFVLKDPRIGRLLRLWIPIVKAHGASPRVIIPVRHPLEVAASLHRREGFPEGKSIYLWLRHMVDAIRDSRNVPRGILLFDELMRDWRTAIERVSRDINVTWPRNLDEAAPSIEQFLDRKLRHHAIDGIRYQSGGLTDYLAAELYIALCNRDNDLDDLVESIHEQLTPLEAVFAPLLQDSSRRLSLAVKDRERLAGEAGARSRAEAELTRLGQEFETKCRHVEQLEQLVASERDAYRHLDEEFKARTQHNILLTKEVAEVTTHLQRVQNQLLNAESEFAKLNAEFETKCRHVEQLEQLVASERDAYRHLDEEFKARTQHNILLTEEVAQLTVQLENLAEQRRGSELAIRDVTERLRMAVLTRSSR